MGVAGSQGPRALSAPRDLGLLRRIGACGGVWGEGQPRTGLWKFCMVIPGCRFARPRAFDRSSLRDGVRGEIGGFWSCAVGVVPLTSIS
jgi:hypothetical protein